MSMLANSGRTSLEEDVNEGKGKSLSPTDHGSPPATVSSSLEPSPVKVEPDAGLKNAPPDEKVQEASPEEANPKPKKPKLWKKYAIHQPNGSLPQNFPEEDLDAELFGDGEPTIMDTGATSSEVPADSAAPPPEVSEPVPEPVEPVPEPTDAGQSEKPGGVDAPLSEGNAMVSADMDAPPSDAVVTNEFLDMCKPVTSSEDPVKESQQDLFMSAGLIVPGIALKKFKLAALEDPNRGGCFVGAAGVADVTMYKVARPKVTGLCLGDFTSDPVAFWQWAVRHLGTKPVGALFLYDAFSLSIDDAAGLGFSTFFFHFFHVSALSMLVGIGHIRFPGLGQHPYGSEIVGQRLEGLYHFYRATPWTIWKQLRQRQSAVVLARWWGTWRYWRCKIHIKWQVGSFDRWFAEHLRFSQKTFAGRLEENEWRQNGRNLGEEKDHMSKLADHSVFSYKYRFIYRSYSL